MANSFFADIVSSRFNSDAVLDISGGGKVLIVSDLHMGSGRRDDLAANGGLLGTILEEYYFKNGWHLVLNGDIEELQRYSLQAIRKRWAEMYRIFDLFAAEGRLYKTLGNHDEELLFEKDYPYPLYNAVRIETGQLPLYVYHGHQSSRVYANFNNLIRIGIRFFLKPVGIRNVSSARSPYRRFSVEKKAYRFSIENNCISVIGHTHRPLFESLGRFDYIKFEIERLCRDYPASREEEREQIAREVRALRLELGKLKRSERRNVLRQSLYGDELPVPCLFNSGSAIGRRGINAIEADGEHLTLVYWFTEGGEMKFIRRGRYKIEKIPGTSCCRTALNRDRLDYIRARVELLGNSPSPEPEPGPQGHGKEGAGKTKARKEANPK